MQNGIQGCFPQKIIPHTLSGYVLSYQASYRRCLFIAEHDKCGDTVFRVLDTIDLAYDRVRCKLLRLSAWIAFV